MRFFLDVVEGRTGNKGTKAKAEQEKGPKKEIDPEVDEGFYAHNDLPRTPTGQESRSRSLCTFWASTLTLSSIFVNIRAPNDTN